MEKLKEEVEKIASDLISTEFSIKVLEEDLPEKVVFQPSYDYSRLSSTPTFRPSIRYSLEEDMVYLYELFKDSEVFKVKKDLSIEVNNLKELFDNSVEKKFVWDLKISGKLVKREIIDIHVKNDGSYRLNSYYDSFFCENDCLKEKLASQKNGKITVYLEKVFLFEVPALNYIVNELNFIFPKGKLIFGKKYFHGIYEDPVFCYLKFNKPIMEIKIGERRRKKRWSTNTF